MDIDITLRNYRSFQKPVHIKLRKGFTGFLGLNNSGKSSLLRFFFELRPIFSALTRGDGLHQRLGGAIQSYQPVTTISEYEEIFCVANNGDIEIKLNFDALATDGSYLPIEFAIEVYRAGSTWSANLNIAGKEYIGGTDGVKIDGKADIITLEGIDPSLRLSALLEVFNTINAMCKF